LRLNFGEAESGKQGRKTFFPVKVDRQSFHSLLIVPTEQDSLILLAALTLHRGMVRSIIWLLSIGSRNLTEQLAPRKNAKAPRMHKDASSWAPSRKQGVTNGTQAE
jgi:hypothetical protein